MGKSNLDASKGHRLSRWLSGLVMKMTEKNAKKP